MTDANHLALPDASSAIAGFGAALRAADYSVRRVRDAIGAGPAVSISPADVPAVQSRLDPRSALGAMIELFLLGLSLPDAHAEAALAPVPLSALVAGRILDHGDDMVRARIRVLPYEDLLVACDRDPDLDGCLESDQLGGIHGSSVLLARITPRRRVDRALDVGCGCGFQALLLFGTRAR